MFLELYRTARGPVAGPAAANGARLLESPRAAPSLELLLQARILLLRIGRAPVLRRGRVARIAIARNILAQTRNVIRHCQAALIRLTRPSGHNAGMNRRAGSSPTRASLMADSREKYKYETCKSGAVTTEDPLNKDLRDF